MRTPLFWKDKTLLSTVLLPVSALYCIGAGICRSGVSPKKLPVRVICVGNLVVGGAGKTPVALALGAMLKAQGKNVHFLSRGYKGSHSGVTQVDIEKHSAAEVGDEPLLLAEVLPTWVAGDRVAGAEAAVKAGAEIIIMDDGFQNPSLHKDISLLVIHGHYGFGNERIMPAGPLREPITKAMQRASAVVMIGEDEHGVMRYIPEGMKVLKAEIHPMSSAEALKNKHVVAFCGIANPRKFYRTLHRVGAIVRKHVSYPDHYNFKSRDMEFLRERARELDAILVTTEKDFVRLPEDMRAEVSVLPVEAVFADATAVLGVLNS